MPDAPAPPAASPAAPTPAITFGGGSSPTPEKPASPAPVSTPEKPGEAAAPEAPERFEFQFDGDEERYAAEERTDDAEVVESYDASKPFDPKIEELLKDQPDVLKSLKQNHYELRQWKTAGFKSPKEVKAYKDRIEKLGGPDAIEKEAGEWATTWAGFQAGDPAVLEEWTKENPEGLTKLSGPMLDWLNRTNPGVWSAHMGKAFMATLKAPNAQGMSALAAFNQLYDLEGIKGNAQAEKLLGQIAEVINDVNKASNATDKPSDRRDDGRSRELQTKERQLHLRELNMKSEPLIDSAVRQAMKVAFKGITLTPEIERELRGRIKTEFNRAQLKDSTFQENARSLLDPKDSDRFLKVLKSAIGRNMGRVALREARMYKGIGGNGAARKAEGQRQIEAGAGTQPQGDRVRYTGPWKQGGPDPSQIDYGAMRAKWGRKGTDERLANHEFIKKGSPDKIHFW